MNKSCIFFLYSLNSYSLNCLFSASVFSSDCCACISFTIFVHSVMLDTIIFNVCSNILQCIGLNTSINKNHYVNLLIKMNNI